MSAGKHAHHQAKRSAHQRALDAVKLTPRRTGDAAPRPLCDCRRKASAGLADDEATPNHCSRRPTRLAVSSRPARSRHKVGGAQSESKEERDDALKRGKATASVIGVRAMGTRFNVLMTVQVPLKQKPRPVAAAVRRLPSPPSSHPLLARPVSGRAEPRRAHAVAG